MTLDIIFAALLGVLCAAVALLGLWHDENRNNIRLLQDRVRNLERKLNDIERFKL